jgi:hypothetical protein
MINRDDVIDLLKLAAVYDQRTVGEEDIRGWLLVGREARWTLPLAQRVLVEHYAHGAGRERITPAHVTDGIRRVRSRAAASFEAPRMPRPVPADYVGWYRAQLGRHVDALAADWADGKAIPAAAPIKPRVLYPTTRRAIEAAAKKTRTP